MRLVVRYSVSLVERRDHTSPGLPPSQENKARVSRAVEFPWAVGGHVLANPQEFHGRIAEQMRHDITAVLKLGREVS